MGLWSYVKIVPPELFHVVNLLSNAEARRQLTRAVFACESILKKNLGYPSSRSPIFVSFNFIHLLHVLFGLTEALTSGAVGL